MADENLTPDGVEGEIARPDNAALPDIQADAHEEPVTPESLASELGWSPKDQWRGDPDDWKPAGDFLKDTVSINKATRRSLKNIEDRMARMTRASETMIERARADERRKVEAELAEAVDEGDHARVRQVSAQLAQLDAPIETAPVQEFATRNASWWQIDPLATQMAINVSGIAAQQGKSAEEQVKAAEDAVRKRFPEYFDEPKAKTKGPAEVAEQQGRTARSNGGNRARGFSDLPAEAKAVALKLEKQGVPKEDYAKEYWKENA